MTTTARLLLGMALATCAAVAEAADFSAGGAEETGCLFTMTGKISHADARRFRDFVRRLDAVSDVPATGPAGPGLRRRLCLDSPGGSLSAAVGIGELLRRGDAEIEASGDPVWLRNLGTAVPPGATCAGACAVLFLAGQQSDGVGARTPDRLLHAAGRLMFPASGPAWSQGSPSGASAGIGGDSAPPGVTTALGAGLAPDVPPEPVAQDFLAPSAGAMLLDSAAQAADLRVKVTGLPPPDRVTRAHVAQACELAAQSAPPVFRSGGQEELARDHHPVILLLRDQPLFTRFERRKDRVRFTITAEEEGDHGCAGEILDDGTGWVQRDGGDRIPVGPWMLYPGGLPLSQLHKVLKGLDRAPADTVLDRREHVFQSTCYAVQGGAVAGKSACSIRSVRRVRATGDIVLRQVLTWENGGAEIVAENGAIRIDGAVVHVETDPPSGLDGPDDVCLDHGNGTFCYRLR